MQTYLQSAKLAALGGCYPTSAPGLFSEAWNMLERIDLA